MSQDVAEQNIQMWKVKKLIKSLDSARGAGTSMISLIIPPKDQISRASAMLTQEYGTASNIKSRVNRLSVLAAITSTQQRLKLYNRVPPNGLVLFVGTILTDEGKEKKVSFDFEPHKPINTSLYLCDNKFHTEALSELLESDSRFGFIVMDGNGTLFGTLAGNTREVIHKFTVDLPKKHGRGGQSALRFSRLRDEKRHNYVRKVAELAVQHFITNDKVNCTGLVLAGSADFKTELSLSDMFDGRLAAKVIKVVDVSYGGENGFNQAIELAAESLANVKFVQEKRLIQKYFDEISQDTGKYCFGIEDTLKALELGAVETLIVWENMDITRYILRNAAGEEIIIHSNKEMEKDREKFMDKSTGLEMEQSTDPQPLLEWFAEKYKEFGANLEFVTNRSQEGAQFVKGFGGIGGLLRLLGAPSAKVTTGGVEGEGRGCEQQVESEREEKVAVEQKTLLEDQDGKDVRSCSWVDQCMMWMDMDIDMAHKATNNSNKGNLRTPAFYKNLRGLDFDSQYLFSSIG